MGRGKKEVNPLEKEDKGLNPAELGQLEKLGENRMLSRHLFLGKFIKRRARKIKCLSVIYEITVVIPHNITKMLLSRAICSQLVISSDMVILS